MACSRFEYVKAFEQPDALLPATYIVVRVDGRGFSRFTADHGYAKPNDVRGLALMNQCAAGVMREWGEAVLAFGESDEYSFVFPRGAGVFGRRAAKLATGIASLFAASFVFHWPRFFPGCALRYPPAFDARCVAYPTLRTVCDYVKWRQVDAHVNALHNEAFWALVLRGGLAPAAAYGRLQGTLSDEKHELLRGFGVNYARLPLLFRRGTTLLRSRDAARLLLEAGLRLDGVPPLPVSGAAPAAVAGPGAAPPDAAALGAAPLTTPPAAGDNDNEAPLDGGHDDSPPQAAAHPATAAVAAAARSAAASSPRRALAARFQAAARTAGCGLDSDAWGVSPRCPGCTAPTAAAPCVGGGGGGGVARCSVAGSPGSPSAATRASGEEEAEATTAAPCHERKDGQHAHPPSKLIAAAGASAVAAAAATASAAGDPAHGGHGGGVSPQPPLPPCVPPAHVELPAGVAMAFPDFLRSCGSRPPPAAPASSVAGAPSGGAEEVGGEEAEAEAEKSGEHDGEAGGGADAALPTRPSGTDGGGGRPAAAARGSGSHGGRSPPPPLPQLFLEALLAPYDD